MPAIELKFGSFGDLEEATKKKLGLRSADVKRFVEAANSLSMYVLNFDQRSKFKQADLLGRMYSLENFAELPTLAEWKEEQKQFFWDTKHAAKGSKEDKATYLRAAKYLSAATKLVKSLQPYREYAQKEIAQRKLNIATAFQQLAAELKYEISSGDSYSRAKSTGIKSTCEHKISITIDEYNTGHVSWNVGDARFTFDRLGVEDSFYMDGEFSIEGVRKIITGQIARVMEQVERRKKLVAEGKEVDFGPFKQTFMADDLAKIIIQLKAGKGYSRYPNGFGTGYRFGLSPKGYGVKHASDELTKLVGKPVYYSTFDCD